MVPTISIFGKDSTFESLESIPNTDVAKVVLPGQNRPIDALKIVHDSKGNISIKVIYICCCRRLLTVLIFS